MTKNDRVRVARERTGISQEDLAIFMGVKQPYIAGIEKNKGFSIKVARKLSKFLGVSAEWIMFGDDADNRDITEELEKAHEEIDKLKSENSQLKDMVIKLQQLALDKSLSPDKDIVNDKP